MVGSRQSVMGASPVRLDAFAVHFVRVSIKVKTRTHGSE